MFPYVVLFFFKQKTAYEMRISDWSSDVCSSDLVTGLLSRAVLKRYCDQEAAPLPHGCVRESFGFAFGRAGKAVRRYVRDVDLLEHPAIAERHRHIPIEHGIGMPRVEDAGGVHLGNRVATQPQRGWDHVLLPLFRP